MQSRDTGAFQAWVERWRIGPGMNDPPGSERYSGVDGTVGEGWINILDRLAEDLVAMGWDRRLDQVKEKFGRLRFYVRTSTADGEAGRRTRRRRLAAVWSLGGRAPSAEAG
jgi:hypothetical protein